MAVQDWPEIFHHLTWSFMSQSLLHRNLTPLISSEQKLVNTFKLRRSGLRSLTWTSHRRLALRSASVCDSQTHRSLNFMLFLLMFSLECWSSIMFWPNRDGKSPDSCCSLTLCPPARSFLLSLLLKTKRRFGSWVSQHLIVFTNSPTVKSLFVSEAVIYRKPDQT